MKKRVKIFGIIIFALFGIYFALSIKYYCTPDMDEIDSQKFIDNQEIFDGIVRYYESLDYMLMLESNEDTDIQIDNIRYELNIGEEFCSLNLDSDSYEIFDINILNGYSISQIMGNFHGFRVDINKTNYQIDKIRIEISDFDTDYYSILCWSSQGTIEEMPTSYVINLSGGWYILRIGLV